MGEWFASIEQSKWVEIGIAIGLRVLGALILLLIGLRVASALSGWIGRALQRSSIEPTAALFLGRVALVALQIVMLLAVVQVLGVPMTSMIAVLGAAGLAIGLALKDSLSNIASGVMLVTLRPFKVGDVVTINGETGSVEMVSIFQTRLRGPDNQTITLPNSLITTDSIINLTPDVRRRIELVIGIGYANDIDLARATAVQIMNADERVLAEPAADVLVYKLGESSVDLGIRCHVLNADFFATKCALLEGIKKAFDDAGIGIPFPQREIRIIAAPAELQAIAIAHQPVSSPKSPNAAARPAE